MESYTTFVVQMWHACHDIIKHAITESTKALVLSAPPLCALDLGLPPEEPLADELFPVVPFAVSSFVTTYISPLASELINMRPWLSKAKPTGLKQLFGQAALFALAKMSV